MVFAPKQMGQHWSAVHAWVFMAVFAIAAVMGHPLSLLHPSINYHTPQMRWTFAGILIVGGVATLIVAWLRKGRALGLVLGGGLLMLGLCFPSLPAGIGGHGFVFALPTHLVLLMPTLFALIYSRWDLPRSWVILIGLFCIGVLFRGLADLRYLPDLLRYLSYLLVPLVVAVLYRNGRLPTDFLNTVAMVIWCWSVAFGLVEIEAGRMPTGISGNPNWLCCTLIGVLPWTLFFAKRLLALKMPCWLAWAISVLLILPVSGFVLYHCRTRALYVAAAVYVLLLAFWLIRSIVLRAIFALLLLAGCFVGALFAHNISPRAYSQDVRGPLWLASAIYVGEKPLFGGGVSGVQRRMPELLADTSYHKRYVAAETMKHPHNEALNLAMLFGLPLALIWLALLYPILRAPQEMSWPLRFAQFSAVFMLVLGMADKGLSIAPSSVWWLAMLGLLWSPVIGLPKLTWRQAHRQRTFSLIMLSGVASIVLTYLSAAVLCSSWLQRRAQQLQLAGVFKEAHRYHQLAWNCRPSQENAYSLATISVQKLHPFDRSLAMDDLDRIYQLNPNYAHVNRLLGRFYMRISDFEEAKKSFLADILLFPEDVQSHQFYLQTVVFTKDRENLPDAERLLNEKYANRVISYADFTGQDGLPRDWISAADDGDWEEAVHAATRSMAGLRGHDYIDPLAPWLRQSDWPRSFIGSRATPADVPFWKSVLLREQLRDKYLTKSKDPLKMVNFFFNNIRLDRDTTDWAMPHEVWEAKTASQASAYTFIAWLSEKPVLIYEDTKIDRSFMLLPLDKHVAKISLRRASVDILTRDELAKRLPKDHVQKLRIVALPHQFLVRHQVLNALAQRFVGDFRPQLEFARLPVIRLQEANRVFADFDVQTELYAVWALPLQAWRERLGQ